MIFHESIAHTRYVKSLPNNSIRVRFITGVELMRLKAGKKKWTAGNLEPRIGLPLLIYSEENKWWWYRILQDDHDISQYRDFISQGILYIHFDEIWRERVIRERDVEGKSYHAYNRLRELLIVKEVMEKKKEHESYMIKLRALDIEIKKLLENEKDN